MRKLELIQHTFAIAASVLAVLSGLAFFVVPGADEIRFRYFGVFLLRSAIAELGMLAVACAVAWAVLRLSRRALAREFAEGVPLMTARHHQLIVLWLGMLAIAITLLAVPVRDLLRARGLYWTRLTRQAYAKHDLTRIGRLARTGRVAQAYTLADRTYTVLKDTPEMYLFGGVVESLAARQSLARTLKGEISTAGTRSWNPITQRDRYFELAEAVRLNPEEYAAAAALRGMHSSLINHALPADARALCSPSAVTPRGRTVSPLESEIRFQGVKTPIQGVATSIGTPNAVSACERSLRVRWALGRVSCILAISRRAQQPFTKSEEDSWSAATLPECRGVALEDVYL